MKALSPRMAVARACLQFFGIATWKVATPAARTVCTIMADRFLDGLGRLNFEVVERKSTRVLRRRPATQATAGRTRRGGKR